MKQNFGMKGRIRFKTRNLDTGEVSYTPWIKNLIVEADGYGLNLVMRALSGLDSLPIQITKAKMGTGDTAVTVGDTDLETPTIDNIEIANVTLVDETTILFEFFMPNFLTPDNTYNEFGTFCGNRLFSRVIIDPAFVKVGNVDTTAEYEFVISNVV
jgi:hypothetical protein